MACYSKEYLRTRLPCVGDLLIKTPITGKQLSICSSKPRRCKVIYVNTEHCWYLVQFETGYREMYKLPELPVYVSDRAHKPRRVQCVETGVIYDTLKDAAKATNCNKMSICNACRGAAMTANGFHWRYADEEDDD